MLFQGTDDLLQFSTKYLTPNNDEGEYSDSTKVNLKRRINIMLIERVILWGKNIP